MALVDQLRKALDEPEAKSFRLMSDDLVRVDGARLRTAASEEAVELDAAMDAELRRAFDEEHDRAAREAHEWLLRHNGAIHSRIRGYLELGRRCRFQYPWPVVAILGLCQVLTGLRRVHWFGLVGPVASRLGYPALEELAEKSDDVLRRTNRAIFADSVPTVLFALRCDEHRGAGRPELAKALLDGPLPPIFDAESRQIVRGIYDGLAISDDEHRFASLAELTLRHFGREQSIYTFQMGGGSRGRKERRAAPSLLTRLFSPTTVSAPVVVRTPRGPRVRFRPFGLPPGFSMRDHAARVEAFGRAFVTSVTRNIEEYQAAVKYVVHRFGKPEERPAIGYREY